MVHRSFVLRISGSSTGGLSVQVVGSPGGESVAVPFEQPLTGEDLERLAHAAVSEPRGGGLRHLLSMGPASPASEVMAIGKRLSDAVFRGPIAVTFADCRGSGDPTEDAPLRIDVRIDPALAEAEALQALPWELLVAPGRRWPLALSRWTPVVRYLELPRGPVPPDLPETLRILVVAPCPAGTDRLDLERELADLHDAWVGGPAGRSRVAVETLEPPTLEALADTLDARPVHVLHFMGHGRGPRPPEHRRMRRAEPGRSGELLFEDAAGAADPVDAELLAMQLADRASSLRVVMLNACDSARGGQDAPVDGEGDALPDGGVRSPPSVSVAAALIEAGVPAVVAMQHPISDPAAIELSRAVYRSLAEGESIDVAVTRGRRALLRARRGTAEWATPALFLRSADGRVFVSPERAPPSDGEPPTRPGPGTTRRWVRWGRPLAIFGAAAIVLAGGFLVERSVRDRPAGREAAPAAAAPASEPVAEEAGHGVDLVPQDGSRTGAVDAEDGAGGDRDGDHDGGPIVSPLRTLSAGESITVDGGVAMTVDFFRVQGEELGRITVAGPDGTVEPYPVAGRGSFTVRTAGGGSLRGPLRVQVTAVDFAKHTVTLRVLSP